MCWDCTAGVSGTGDSTCCSFSGVYCTGAFGCSRCSTSETVTGGVVDGARGSNYTGCVVDVCIVCGCTGGEGVIGYTGCRGGTNFTCVCCGTCVT